MVLNWITGNPRRFKIYVSNRVSTIVDAVPPSRWSHVSSPENPADCASRGILPYELLSHDLWWNGPKWLRLGIHQWPKSPSLSPNSPDEEAGEMCSHAVMVSATSLIPLGRYSSFTRLLRVTAWIRRFVNNSHSQAQGRIHSSGSLSTAELSAAEVLWLAIAQSHTFQEEIECLRNNKALPKSSTLHPFLDHSGLVRVGGRLCNSQSSFSQLHPVILSG